MRQCGVEISQRATVEERGSAAHLEGSTVAPLAGVDRDDAVEGVPLAAEAGEADLWKDSVRLSAGQMRSRTLMSGAQGRTGFREKVLLVCFPR